MRLGRLTRPTILPAELPKGHLDTDVSARKGAKHDTERKSAMLEWLTEEFAQAVARVRPAHAEWMREQGVFEFAQERAGGFGVARARFDSEGGWEPAEEDGEAAILLPAWSPVQEGPYRVLYDLVAFRPSRPDAPARRRLDAVWLGEDELEVAAYWHLPVTVRSNPMAWLRAGARGVVPLDWNEAIQRLLEFGAVEGEDEAMTARLHTDLVRALLARMPLVSTERKTAKAERAERGERSERVENSGKAVGGDTAAGEGKAERSEETGEAADAIDLGKAA